MALPVDMNVLMTINIVDVTQQYVWLPPV